MKQVLCAIALAIPTAREAQGEVVAHHGTRLGIEG
jgi:hypothetical protein